MQSERRNSLLQWCSVVLIATGACVCVIRFRQLLLIECFLVASAAITAFAFPGFGSGLFTFLERGLARLAQRRGEAVLVVGLAALVLRAAILPILPIPVPGVHDEFSYLLMADTFAHGRLANPTHPMWVHFETFYVLQQPTYSSMFHPAQGVFLAVGEIFLGHPFWGVWLSGGLMCAAVCWMLQGWLPPFWALIGGLLAVLRLSTFSYWVNSYFGGAVAALGGALVLGALPRIKRQGQIRNAFIMGVGLSILAISRPYESVFFCLPIAISLFAWLLGRSAPPLKSTLLRVVLPLSILLIFTLAGIGYYFFRVTGSPLRDPYVVNLATYMPMPYFPWGHLRAIPEYHHEILRRFYTGYNLGLYDLGRQHPVIASLVKLGMAWFFYFGPLFSLPLLMLGVVLPRGFSYQHIGRRTRFLLVVAGITVFGVLLPIVVNPHYLAPLVCVFYALLLTSMARIRHWRSNGSPTGLALVRAIPTVAIALFVLKVSAPVLHISDNPAPWTWCSPWAGITERARIQTEMEQLPGRQLLLVHYGPEHDIMAGWVYNDADIDGSKVVWANDMGPEKNQELIQYFKDRQVWLVDPDQMPARVSPYR